MGRPRRRHRQHPERLPGTDPVPLAHQRRDRLMGQPQRGKPRAGQLDGDHPASGDRTGERDPPLGHRHDRGPRRGGQIDPAVPRRPGRGRRLEPAHHRGSASPVHPRNGPGRGGDAGFGPPLARPGRGPASHGARVVDGGHPARRRWRGAGGRRRQAECPCRRAGGRRRSAERRRRDAGSRSHPAKCRRRVAECRCRRPTEVGRRRAGGRHRSAERWRHESGHRRPPAHGRHCGTERR